MASVAKFIPEAWKANVFYRSARALCHFREMEAYKRLRQTGFRNDRRRIVDYLQTEPQPRLHIGCGTNPLRGWLNTDFYPDSPDVCHVDATRKFPLPNSSFDLVFTEHVIEHLPLAGGLNLLAESFRILKPGGRIRVGTPSMRALIAIYSQPDEPLHRAYLDWHREMWLNDQPLVTPALVFNDFYRNWGHLCIYDEDTLCAAMERVGFTSIVRVEQGQSDDPRLRGLEHAGHMPPGLLALHTLTLEAVKPGALEPR